MPLQPASRAGPRLEPDEQRSPVVPSATSFLGALGVLGGPMLLHHDRTVKQGALAIRTALASLVLALPLGARAQAAPAPDDAPRIGLGVHHDMVVAHSIRRALELPRPAELEAFGRLAPLRRPASI